MSKILSNMPSTQEGVAEATHTHAQAHAQAQAQAQAHAQAQAQAQAHAQAHVPTPVENVPQIVKDNPWYERVAKNGTAIVYKLRENCCKNARGTIVNQAKKLRSTLINTKDDGSWVVVQEANAAEMVKILDENDYPEENVEQMRRELLLGKKYRSGSVSVVSDEFYDVKVVFGTFPEAIKSRIPKQHILVWKSTGEAFIMPTERGVPGLELDTSKLLKVGKLPMVPFLAVVSRSTGLYPSLFVPRNVWEAKGKPELPLNVALQEQGKKVSDQKYPVEWFIVLGGKWKVEPGNVRKMTLQEASDKMNFSKLDPKDIIDKVESIRKNIAEREDEVQKKDDKRVKEALKCIRSGSHFHTLQETDEVDTDEEGPVPSRHVAHEVIVPQTVEGNDTLEQKFPQLGTNVQGISTPSVKSAWGKQSRPAA
jgi:hypothetical protein